MNSYKRLMIPLTQVYLCGYSIYHMIRVEFPHRFGNFNHEGFCYTFSAAIMIGLKSRKSSRLVRGFVISPDYHSDHSWVEIKAFGRWWVIDPVLLINGMTYRRRYYQKYHPEILAVYSYRVFWRDPAAHKFWERMCCLETSKIFVDLFWHYTPRNDGIEIPNMKDDKLRLPDKQYYLFPPIFGYHFDQEIVNEFMARPTRKSPRRRTLRRLNSYYRKKSRELAKKHQS